MGLLLRGRIPSRRRYRAFVPGWNPWRAGWSLPAPRWGPCGAGCSRFAPDGEFLGNLRRIPAGRQLRPGGASFITRDSSGRVAVELSADDPNALVGPLQGLGASVTGIATASHLLDAYVPVDQLPNLAALTGQGLLAARAVGMITSTGLVDAQSDQMTEADRLRAVNGLTGTGVTVGVLSDSYNNLGTAAADIASGDLPVPVFVRDNVPANTGVTGEDEGRGMRHTSSTTSPRASRWPSPRRKGARPSWPRTSWTWPSPSPTAAPCARVITDDVSYFAEPFYQDGTIAQAVNTVAAGGVVYTAAAGNIDNNAYENTSPSLTSDPVFTANGTNFINFGTAASPTARQSVRLQNGQAFIITLEWDSPFFNAAGDTLNLSIYLVNPTNQSVVAAGNVNTIGWASRCRSSASRTPPGRPRTTTS